jgi:hypothetical protein
LVKEGVMQEVKGYLAARRFDFAQHEFFKRLETSHGRAEVACALSQIAFWVAAFQDVLAVTESRIVDDRFREVARRHQQQDAAVFFEDLHRLGMAALSAEELLTKPLAPIRRAAFALMSEVLRASNDMSRLTLLLALESMGHIFFEATAAWVERVGAAYKVDFRAQFRTQPMIDDDFLDGITLDEEVRATHLAAIDRSYAAFLMIFDTLLESITQVPKPLSAAR